jgi:hypothetical protein
MFDSPKEEPQRHRVGVHVPICIPIEDYGCASTRVTTVMSSRLNSDMNS